MSQVLRRIFVYFQNTYLVMQEQLLIKFLLMVDTEVE